MDTSKSNFTLSKSKLFAICNIPFALYAFCCFFNIQGFLLSFSISMIIFVSSGIAWRHFLSIPSRDIVVDVFLVILLSTAVSVVGLMGFYVLRIPMNIPHFIGFLIIAVNIGVFAFRGSSEISWGKRAQIPLLVVFLIVYAAIYYNAAYEVEPSVDNDLELQGTAYGIMHYLKPQMLTDRATVYYFAHPLLVHLYSAQSILLSGDLENTKYYYDAAMEGEVRGRKNLGEIERQEYQMFFQRDCLVPTRNPHMFFSALSGIILFLMLFQITSSRIASAGGVFLFFSFPEIFFLSTCEIYTSISIFSLLLAVYFLFKEDEQGDLKKPFLLFLTGCFMAFSNHKMVILPTALMLREVLSRMGRTPFWDICISILRNKIIAGFVLGSFLFWGYGLIVDAESFLTDHVRFHLWNRFFHINDLGYSHHPSFLIVWERFIGNYGMVFLLLAFISTAYFLKDVRDNDRKEPVLALLSVVGAVVFSFVDWKSTTHFSLIAPSLFITVFLFLNERNNITRVIGSVLLAISLFHNLIV